MATSIDIPVQTLRSLRGAFFVKMSSRGKYNRSSNQNWTGRLVMHSFCSNMANSGMNPKTLQYMMGCCVPFGTR